MEREPESENTTPRKRIAVACGRCRKRKIRCSGDPGTGQPCHNCKNAGAEPCRFLRVSSTETTLRNESNFHYNMDSARAYQARGAVASLSPAVSQFPDGLPAMASGEMLGSYRHGATSTAAYPSYTTAAAGKQPYYASPAVPGWATQGYAEDGVDYGGLQYGQPPHSYLTLEDEVRLTTKSPPASRFSPTGKYSNGAGAGAATSGNIYIDVDPGYPYTNSPTLVHRPSAAPISAVDLPNFSLSGMPQHLHSSSSKERLLPSPTRSLPSSNGVVGYRNDHTTTNLSTNPYQQTKVTSVASSTHTSPINTLSDVTGGGYSSFDHSPLAAYPSTTASQASSTSSTSSRGTAATSIADIYSHQSSSAHESIFSAAENSLRSQSGAELSYRYSDTRGDSGASAPSQLANGQVYTTIPPLPSVGGSSGAAPYLMAGGGGGGGAEGEGHRRAVAGLHAA